VKAEKPMAIFVSYGSVEALDEKYRDFENKLEKLIEDLAPTRARFVLFAPTPLERDSNNVISRRMQSCARSVGDVAERGGHRFADLHSQLMKHPRRNDYTFTDNGLHFSDAGYEGTIPDFFNTLGLSWSGESPQRYEAVRKAVLKKNELFFNQWRPQNETYLFGFRKREQGQNAKEVEQFNALIAKVESEITTALNAKTN